ncbi:C25 family cysteine peptidase [Candidatus Laterigemmans baculatus]|uniref:C25 family cysteine peptidase n=1 Tax=Candidatus Laterigemmans baculatus TaxID=2770505 RepID=UPI0013DD0FD0|nr:C25 family cysteine peptidase [Candidatus Laterigemmans baculatus]
MHALALAALLSAPALAAPPPGPATSTPATSIAAPRAATHPAAATGDAAADCFVVCPPLFRQSLAPWIEHRTRDGLNIKVLASGATAAEVLQNLREAGLGPEAKYVVLVGDCRIVAADHADASREVPTHYRLPGPSARYGTTPTLAGDAPYGDLDGDGIPEIAVGRLPVRTPEQLSGLVERVIRYEQSSDFGPWRDTVQLTAGTGGFGMLADAAIESATRAVLTSSLPASVRTAITYAAPASPFNPGSRDFFPSVLRRYREGGLFWVYMGHGNVTELDRVPGPNGPRPVLDSEDVELLERPAEGAPIALMLACYTGAFDASEDALAERMLLAEGGPIAVLAGSRVTMPYGNAIAAQGLIQAVYHERLERLGDAWLYAQRELASEAAEVEGLAERRRLLDLLAGMLSPSADALSPERREHVHLYNLLGDPALRLRHPGELSVSAPRGIAPGETLTVRGVAPHRGKLTVSICPLPGGGPIDAEAPRVERYEQANCLQVAETEITSQAAGPFEVAFVVPPSASGPMRIVARLEGGDGWSVGSAPLLVRPN